MNIQTLGRGNAVDLLAAQRVPFIGGRRGSVCRRLGCDGNDGSGVAFFVLQTDDDRSAVAA